MKNEKLLRDPVHDLIVFDRDLPEDRLLLAAMDTAEVQRLRRIKQLGMAHMAYQGAEHSRFSHSMGVLHLVRRMLDRLAHNEPVAPEWKLATQLAGLLHDLGHGPFSHVMEKFFREHHETWTERIILSPATQVNRVLTAYDPKLPAMVVDALHGRAEPLWLNSIISSQMDADRFDYLLRDSHMTGVKYGIFDLERLLMLLRIGSSGDRIVVARKGVLPVEKYLQSRYQMYRQVYFHKTVTAAEAMLMSVLSRARDMAADGPVPHVDPGTPLGKLLSKDEITVDEFLALDDSVLYHAMNLWSRCDDDVLRDLSDRLLNRRLFKSIEVQSDADGEDLLFSERLHAAQEFLEQRGLDYRYYLRFSRSSDTPYKPYGSRGGKAVIWLEDDMNPGEYVDVKDVSPTIRAFTESPYTIIRAFFPEKAGDESIRAELTQILLG
ncbi:HD domain-containing protein [bacterium]|nr:HD domain-containing protein [bacterium]